MSKPIIINNFHKGLASSAFTGFQEFRNLNVFDKPGIIYPNPAPSKNATLTDLIFDIAYDDNGKALWGISETKLYKGNTSVTLPSGGSSGTHYGLFIWRDYLFLLAGTSIDVLDLSDETTWTKAWKSVGGSAKNRPSIISQNDNVYFGMGNNNLGMLSEVAGKTFSLTDSSTYTFKNNSDPALDIPEGFIIRDLEELGYKLLICAGRSDYEANIYTWNRSDSSFDNVLKFYEDGDNAGWQIITIGNTAYVQVGKRGHWYITNGTSVEPFVKLPETMKVSDSLLLYRKAIAYVNGKIYFGLSTDSTDTGQGIYSLNIKTGQIVLENTISTGQADDTVYIGYIYNLGGGVYVYSFYDGTANSYGTDSVSTYSSTLRGGNTNYFITEFFQVGTKENPRSFLKPTIQLAKPLDSDSSLKIHKRTAQNGTWTSYYAQTTTDFQSGIMSSIVAVENIQLKVFLNKNVELMSIILK